MALGHHWIGVPDLTELRDNGNTNLARDYSVDPKTAIWQAPYLCLVVHMSIVLVWEGRTLDPGLFGEREPLQGGIEFELADSEGNLLDSLLPGNVLRRNVDFLRWSENIVYMGETTLAPQLRGFAAHYEAYDAWGAPVTMYQDTQVRINLTDDLSSLDELRVHLVTWKLDPKQR